MSVQAMSRVMEFSEAAGINRLVLLVMANRAGGDFDECFASTDRLAFECRIDGRTVQRAIKRLVTANDLVLAGIHPKHRTNIYRVMPAATVSMFAPAGVAESHPPVTTDTPAPPELKELGVRGSSTASTSSHPTYPALFEIFWKIYPLHVGKRAASRRWKEALRRAKAEEIIAGAERYRDDPRRDPDKTKHAEGWLNADRWADESTAIRPSIQPQPSRSVDDMTDEEIEEATR